mmetsp:Transcript_117004/g.164439  ORF Transcript_117004/g.164439 Transcript_117004/m.164439 type:complete len:145 (-) Transcript_117004:105-539(-)|eukprot:s324_g10.t1
MASQRAASKRKAKQGQSAAAANPEKDNLPEERLVGILDQVVQGVLKAPPPTAAGVPQSVMEVLCGLHPRYRDWAEFRAMKAEEKRLQEELQSLKTQTTKPAAPRGRAPAPGKDKARESGGDSPTADRPAPERAGSMTGEEVHEE